MSHGRARGFTVSVDSVDSVDSVEGTVICSLPGPASEVPRATAVRGTVVTSSLQVVRELGLEPAYLERLKPSFHEAVAEVLVRSWVPMKVAHAHYEALDALELGDDQIRANGGVIADRIQRTYAASIFRTLRVAGALTPLNALARADVGWRRAFEGSAVEVRQTGPKDATIIVVALPLMEIPYFRVGFEGLLHATGRLLSPSVFVRCETPSDAASVSRFRASWV